MVTPSEVKVDYDEARPTGPSICKYEDMHPVKNDDTLLDTGGQTVFELLGIETADSHRIVTPSEVNVDYDELRSAGTGPSLCT
jgi:hypothetical protein